MIDEWIAENGLGNLQDIYIGDYFSCSSSSVVNGFFRDLGVMIDEETGLKKLRIHQYADKNTLEDESMEEIFLKCPALEVLEISGLFSTTPENRSQLLDMAAKISANSESLHTLTFVDTCSTKEDGSRLF